MGICTITELRDQLDEAQHALSFVGSVVGSVPLMTESERLGAQVILGWVTDDLIGTSKSLGLIDAQRNKPS